MPASQDLKKRKNLRLQRFHVVAGAPRLRGVVGAQGVGAAAGTDAREPLRRAAAVAPQGAHQGGGLAGCECRSSAGKPAARWLPSQAGHG